ncbi:MAG: hypothetical protein K0S48_773 [Ramlibacter sp.]|jgi:hypothetical protein|nr:hypothetical protein [Ramlibacter sp.]
MKTDDLIALLAAEAEPVPRRAARRRLAWAMAAALPLSVAWMAAFYGVRPGLVAGLSDPMAWIKMLLPAAVGLGGFVLTERLARPGVPVRSAWLAIAAPLLLLWALGLAAWTTAAPEARADLLFGRTWRTCTINIAAIALPLFAAAIIALRGLAPTRPALAGAAAGVLAGGVGAAVYALHCPELAAPFLAVWYVLGMAVPAVAGAALGRVLLRW